MTSLSKSLLPAMLLGFATIIAAAPAQAQFAAPSSSLFGNAPSSTTQGVATADLNGDGKPDVVLTNATGVDVYYSTPNGMNGPFTYSTRQSCQYGPSAVAIGDLDGDGYQDLVVNCGYLLSSASTQGAVIVLWGNRGDFSNQTIIPTFKTPNALALGDLDGDGLLDIFLAKDDAVENTCFSGQANACSIRLASFRNQGGRAFAAMSNVEMPTNAPPRQIVAADFNGDGRAELAVAATGHVYIFSSYLDTVLADIPYADPNTAWAIAAADFDRDGKLDLAVGNYNGSIDFYEAGSSRYMLAPGWNSQTRKWDTQFRDYVMSFSSWGSVSTHPTLLAGQGLIGGVPSFLTVGDFNGDGLPDVSSANTAAGGYQGGPTPTATVALSNGHGFTEVSGSPFALGNIADFGVLWGISSADFNGDGRLDIIVPAYGSGYPPSSPVILTNTTAVLKTTPAALTFWASAGGSAPAGIAIAVQSDAATAGNVFTATTDQPWLAASPTSGATGTSTPVTLSVDASTLTPGAHTATVAFAAPNFTGARTPVMVNVARPSGTLVSASTQTVSSPYSGLIRNGIMGDFNGDGQIDLAVTGVTLLSNGAGGFTASQYNFVDYDASWENNGGASVTADFNHDGKLDIAYVQGDANLAVLLGRGDGTFNLAGGTFLRAPGGSAALTSLVAGDFNGDGIPDLLAGSSNFFGRAPLLFLFFGQGNGTFSAPVAMSTPSASNCFSLASVCQLDATQLVAGDFNGDGSLDFAMLDKQKRKVSVMLGTGFGGFSLMPGSGSYPDPQHTNRVLALAAADVNADGFTDLMLGIDNPGTPRGAVQAFLGNATLGSHGDPAIGLSSAFVAMPPAGFTVDSSFGFDGQQMVVADVNGDGKPDIVETHAFSTLMTVLSGDGTGRFGSPQQFNTLYAGSPNPDFAFVGVGDVNGDGLNDVLVLNEGGGPGGLAVFTGGAIQVTATLTITNNGQAQFGGTAPVSLTVTGGLGVPTGTAALQATDGAGNVYGNMVSSQTTGPWTFPLNALPIGTYTVTATFTAAGGNFSTSNAVSIIVNQGYGTLALDPVSPASPTTTESLTFTARLSPASPACSDQVTFTDNGTPIGTVSPAVVGQVGGVNVCNGVFTSAPVTLSAGAHQIKAALAGTDPNFVGVNTQQGNIFAGTVNVTVTQIYTINLSASATFTYDGSAHTLSPTTNPAGGSATVSYSQNGSPVAAPTAAGTYAYTATVAGQGTQNQITGTLVITKADAHPAISNTQQIFDGTPKLVTVTTSPANLSVTTSYTPTDAQGNPTGSATSTPTAIGQYAVTATVNDANYTGTATATLFIQTPAVASTTTLTLAPGTPTYGDTVTMAVTVSGSATHIPSGIVTVKDGSTVVATGALSAAGTATFTTNTLTAGTHGLTAVYGGDTYNNGSTSAVSFITLAKKAATVSFVAASLSATYDGTPKAAQATTTAPSGTFTFTYAGSANAPVNAGSYTVVVGLNDPNYQGGTTGTLTIAPAPAPYGFLASSLTQTYTGTPHAVSLTGVPAGVNVAITYAGLAAGPTFAGSYALQTTSANYLPVTGTLVIGKATAAIVLHGLTGIGDGTPKVVTPVTAPAGLGYTLTYNGSTTAPSAAGTYTVVATIVDLNYQGTQTGTLSIHAKNTTTITFSPWSGTYGSAITLSAKVAFAPAAGKAPTGPVTFKEGPTVIGTGNIAANGVATATVYLTAGAHTLTASYGGDGENLGSGPATQTATVAKATAGISFSGLAATYNTAAHPVTVTTVPAGLATSTVTYTPTTGGAASTTAPTSAGSYTVSATVNTANYSGTGTATLVIARANATVTIGTNIWTFDGTAKPATATTVPANLPLTFSYRNNATGAVSATAPSGSGVYTVTATVNSTNYTGSGSGPEQIIGRGTATVSFSGASTVNWDGNPHSLTITTRPAGLATRVYYTNAAGGVSSTAPTGADIYTVTATVDDPSYTGTGSATLTILAKVTFSVAPATSGATPRLDGGVLGTSVGVGQALAYVMPGVHTVSAPDFTVGTSNFTFGSWSDGGANTHTIQAGPGPVTLTATYKSQHQWTINLSNAGASTVATDANVSFAGAQWVDDGASFALGGFGDASHELTSWTKDGVLVSSNQRTTFTADTSAHTVVANFRLLQPTISIGAGVPVADSSFPFYRDVTLRIGNAGPGAATNVTILSVTATPILVANGPTTCELQYQNIQFLDPRQGVGLVNTSNINQCTTTVYTPQVTAAAPPGFTAIPGPWSSIGVSQGVQGTLMLNWPVEALRVTFTVAYTADGITTQQATFTLSR